MFMYSSRVDAKSFIESLYDEFGIPSPTKKYVVVSTFKKKKKKSKLPSSCNNKKSSVRQVFFGRAKKK